MQTIEYAMWKVIIRNKLVHILGLYHPPANAKDKTTNNMFIDDITELLSEKNIQTRLSKYHRRL